MTLTYEDARQLIALDRVIDPHRELYEAMLGELDLMESCGMPAPNWVELEFAARDRMDDQAEREVRAETAAVAQPRVHWACPVLAVCLAWMGWMTATGRWT